MDCNFARACFSRRDSRKHRAIATFHHALLPWALRTVAPEGVDHATWDAALDQAIRSLFSTTTT